MNLENREDLIVHIEGLQATLTKRNARIAELEAKLAIPVDMPEHIQKLIDKSYKKGWRDCSKELLEITRQTALELGKVRKEAFRYYMKGAENE